MIPLTFHWYDGMVPPLTGMAVYVTEVPAQTGLADAAMETLTGNNGLTIIVIVFDMAGEPVAQVSFDARVQVTWSLVNGMYEYTGLSIPTMIPLTFHW